MALLVQDTGAQAGVPASAASALRARATRSASSVYDAGRARGGRLGRKAVRGPPKQGDKAAARPDPALPFPTHASPVPPKSMQRHLQERRLPVFLYSIINCMTPAPIPSPASGPSRAAGTLGLPDDIAAALWRGNELCIPRNSVVTTGFPTLDRELPGGGWPVGCATELLQPQYSLAEVQLLLPSVSSVCSADRQVLVIGAPHQPFLAGWRAWGISESHVLVVQPHTPAEALWATEQAVRADGIGAVMAWLPHARPDQVRRLQACASGSGFPVFLMRAQDAALQSSAAPLRVQARLAGAGQIAVHVLKRRGPAHDGELVLSTASPRLAPLLRHRRGAPGQPCEVSRDALLDRLDTRALPAQRLGLVGR